MQRPYRYEEMQALHSAILHTRKNILLSLSPGDSAVFGTQEIAENIRKFAFTWRISDDIWDDWEQLKHQFSLCAAWAHFSGKGKYMDADILPIGRLGPRPPVGQDRQSKLAFHEQRLALTLWIISQSTLMLGCHLPSLSCDFLNWIMDYNAELIWAYGSDQHEFLRENNFIGWCAKINGDSTPHNQEQYAMALFNLDTYFYTFHVHIPSIFDINIWKFAVTDVWAKASVGTIGPELVWGVHPHSCVLLLLKIFTP